MVVDRLQHITHDGPPSGQSKHITSSESEWCALSGGFSAADQKCRSAHATRQALVEVRRAVGMLEEDGGQD